MGTKVTLKGAQFILGQQRCPKVRDAASGTGVGTFKTFDSITMANTPGEGIMIRASTSNRVKSV